MRPRQNRPGATLNPERDSGLEISGNGWGIISTQRIGEAPSAESQTGPGLKARRSRLAGGVGVISPNSSRGQTCPCLPAGRAGLRRHESASARPSSAQTSSSQANGSAARRISSVKRLSCIWALFFPQDVPKSSHPIRIAVLDRIRTYACGPPFRCPACVRGRSPWPTAGASRRSPAPPSDSRRATATSPDIPQA